MLVALKLVLVCVMLVPVVMLVLVSPNCVHVPDELLHHVAVMVWLSASLAIVYSVGLVHIPVCVLLGDCPVCVGGLFSVSVYVLLFHAVPSVKLSDQVYVVPGFEKLVLVCVMLVLFAKLVLVRANWFHVPLLFQYHVAFILSFVLLSMHVT